MKHAFILFSFSSDELRKSLTKCLTISITKAVPTGEQIASGKFSSIVELKIAASREKVVGKIFNIDTADTEQLLTNVGEINERVKIILSLLHENVVQIKGVCFLPDTIMPVLLMERMMTDLKSYIKYYPSSISLKESIGILCDIASGLHYLHSLDPPFIHGNLTTDNVLLDLGLKAKIGGFAIASTSHLPSNYTPPEAQDSSTQPQYTLDIFSFGHLALCAILQEEVGQLRATQYFNNEFGEPVVRHEVDRRDSSVKKAEKILSENKYLFKVIKDCLSNFQNHRPSARKLFHYFTDRCEDESLDEDHIKDISMYPVI